MVEEFSAEDLFDSISSGDEFVLLDVREPEAVKSSMVEGPRPIELMNIPFLDFLDSEESSCAQIPKNRQIKVVCAKEGSSQSVCAILTANGFDNLSYLNSGLISWANLLKPKRINPDGDGYELWQFIRPAKASCSYGLIHAGEMYLFDPSRNIEFYRHFAKEKGVILSNAFETHLQADYISGAPRLATHHSVSVHAHRGDFSKSKFSYKKLGHEQIFKIGNSGPEIRVIHAPGHTPGSVCFIVDERYMLAGDTVFVFSVGRPDLGNKVASWSKSLFETLQDRILPLDDDISVLPGHFMSWKEADSQLRIMDSLHSIKERNSEIYGLSNADQFIRYIMHNLKEQPSIYEEIRKVNQGLMDVDQRELEIMDVGKNQCATSDVNSYPRMI